MALSPSQNQLLKSSRTAANDLGENGKNLTGLIGELSVCAILNMTWEPQTGYDCVDGTGQKVQVKTRRNSTGGKVKKQGRMGRFGRRGHYRFDYGLYVELGPKYEVDEIRKASAETIKKMEQTEKQDRGLPIRTFRRNASKIYPWD